MWIFQSVAADGINRENTGEFDIRDASGLNVLCDFLRG